MPSLPPISEHEIHHSLRKRLFDLLFSSAVLALGFPLFFLLALCVKCTSRGPIFFMQERVGRGGKRFLCYKFRTMFWDAEERLHQLLVENPEIAKEWVANRKLRKDPRVTSFGRFLRMTSLDELPQFWNVLKGDLSVVGPRPVVWEEAVHHFGERAAIILRVRPGITGLWQVSGRSDLKDYQQRAALEEAYVRNWTFAQDLWIVLRTIPSVLLARGAY